MNVRNFTLNEFVRSEMAVARGIDNKLPDSLEPDAWATLALMQGIRDKLSMLADRDVPISISSGYRCPALNAAVGSGPGSDHILAKACDFKAPAFGAPLQICQALAPLVSILGIGQLIYERPRGVDRAWVHVSTKPPARPVNRIITVTERGTLAGIVP